MDEWQVLRQTTLRFGSEVERVVEGNWVSMPMPLVILVDAIESEPILRTYLEACIAALEPSGFDAAALVDRVVEEAGSAFGPYAADDPCDVARAFCLTRTLVERGYTYDDPLFAHYGAAAARHQERFEQFVADVVSPLIDATTAELDRQREALGPCPYEEAADETATTPDEEATATPAVATPEQLALLVQRLEAATDTLALGDQQDVRLQIEALRDELFCEQPKQRVAAALVRVLRLLGGSAEFLQALAPLEQAIATMA